jgi:hypothetical protein
MKKLLLFGFGLLSLVANAQNNILITNIVEVPSPVKMNFNQITMDVTNINANQTYAMLFTKRLDLGFAFYITFASPSNSITIVRQTTNSITIRLYRVASTNVFGYTGGFYIDGPSEWDEHDMVCEECEQEEQAQQELRAWQSLLVEFGFVPEVPQEILDVIMPPPLRRQK